MTKSNAEKDINKVLKLINEKKFSEGLSLLDEIMAKQPDEATMSYANYLKGYIYYTYANNDRNPKTAKQYFLKSIESTAPTERAFQYMADLEDDKNVVNNCLQLGLKYYPNSPIIYKQLLIQSKSNYDKEKYISDIIEKNIKDFEVMAEVIEYFISQNNWESTGPFIQSILDTEDLDADNKIFFELLKGLFLANKDDTSDLQEAGKILNEVKLKDIKNNLNYAPYIGLLLIYIKQNNTKELNNLFDNIPTSKITFADFEPCPWSPIWPNLEKLYLNVFCQLSKLYKKDAKRREKNEILKIIYMYSPKYSGFDNRCDKKDIGYLKRYLSKNPYNNKILYYIIINTQINYNLYLDAFCSYMDMVSYGVPEDLDYPLLIDDAIFKSSDNEFGQIYNAIIKKLKDESLFNTEFFVSDAFDSIIDKIWGEDGEYKYEKIAELANFSSLSVLKKSNKMFEIAFAYGGTDKSKAETFYKEILKTQPNNSAVLNNLGVIYENKGEESLAYEYYLMAYKNDPNDTIAKNNITNVRKYIRDTKEEKIKSFAKNINLIYLEVMGYNQDLEDRLINIKDIGLRKIISRDIQECVICIVSHQNKAGMILCGSILETVLTALLMDKNIEKYTLYKSTKNESEKSIKNMTLNELLYVANDISILSKDKLQLSHFIKDYRNAIHPITELKNEIDFSDNNASIAWTILKDILIDILK
ncbi:MAG: hypothetical protein LBQ49_02920 [Rickettsiales bacterium]|jgi:hypothetical protein|nr:hypothetical protein [Rickettsiales bacterium]